MTRLRLLSLLALALALAAPLGAQAAPGRKVTCLVLVVEGESAEGNALFQRYMGLQPELLRSYAPSRFELTAKGLSVKAEGLLSYEAGGLVEVERRGRAVLSSVEAVIRGAPPPKAWKRAAVELALADLAAAGGAVQPGAAAIEAAARKLKLKRGVAWVESIGLAAPGLIEATVAFAK